MDDEKKYWLDQECYSGIPGTDVYKAMEQLFADYYTSQKMNKVSIQLNDVTVTLERNRWPKPNR